jgi:amino acid permease
MISNKEYFLLTALIYITIVSLAMFVESLTTIIGIVGTLSCIITCFILPSLFYLKLDEEAKTMTKLRALVILFLGLVFLLLCGYKILMVDLEALL